jgi:sugar lactone lactonase YvrE
LALSNQEVTVYNRGDTGDVTPIATIMGSNTGLAQAVGIGIDAVGKIYVANFDPTSVTVYAPGANGSVAPIAAISGPHTGLARPQGLAVDSAGTIYVANGDSASVTVYSAGATGDIPPQSWITGSNTGLWNPNGIAVDSKGNIYVSNTGLNRDDAIVVFGPGANGNASPNAVISGNLTGLAQPGAMTMIPADP